MANSNSPFSRSQMMHRSPPPTPTQRGPPNPVDPTNSLENNLPNEVVATEEIQRWMRTIDDVLNEVCTIVGEGKMNSDQKLRVNNLCRNVSNGTSQMAVMYQSLKQKMIQARDRIQYLQAQQSHTKAIDELKQTVETKMQPTELTSYAHIVKKGADNLVRPANLSAIAIYPSDKTKTSDETKALVQKIISPEAFKLQVRGIKKVRNGGVLISTENKGDIDKLRGSNKLASSGLTIEEPSKRRPRIIIIGVPLSLSEKEVLDCIYEQNLSDKVPNYTRESFAETVKISHKSGVTSLRDVVLSVEPSIVIRGGTATLICSRDMQDDPLYSVKWYRGNHEFYRYIPNEKPDMRVFPLAGIHVDTEKSNGSQVLLRKLDLGLAGNFSCEVTAESPSFATQIATRFVDVIVLPLSGPILKADKDRYQPGEMLQANCTSSPAKPAANLTIFINEEALRSSEMSLHPTESGFYWTNVKADIQVTQDLFIGGRLRVACLATVYDVYRSSANLDFFTPETDPRPERITHNGTSSAKYFQSWILLLFLFLLPMVIGQDFDFTVHEYEDYDEATTPSFTEALVIR